MTYSVKNDILIKVKDKTSFLTCFQATNSQNKIHLIEINNAYDIKTLF